MSPTSQNPIPVSLGSHPISPGYRDTLIFGSLTSDTVSSYDSTPTQHTHVHAHMYTHAHTHVHTCMYTHTCTHTHLLLFLSLT